MANTKTAVAQENPFEGLPFRLISEYQRDRHTLSADEREKRNNAFILSCYFASNKALSPNAPQPIGVLVQAIEATGGTVSAEHRRQYSDIVSFAPARYGIVLEGEYKPQIVPAIDVFCDQSMDQLERCRLLAEKIAAAEVAIIPMMQD